MIILKNIYFFYLFLWLQSVNSQICIGLKRMTSIRTRFFCPGNNVVTAELRRMVLLAPRMLYFSMFYNNSLFIYLLLISIIYFTFVYMFISYIHLYFLLPISHFLNSLSVGELKIIPLQNHASWILNTNIR